jgi:hypothetical protein
MLSSRLSAVHGGEQVDLAAALSPALRSGSLRANAKFDDAFAHACGSSFQ